MQNLDKYNFHSHTKRCGHAYGNDEDYITNAIKDGFKYYGMSDHVMFPFLNQRGVRGDYDLDFCSYIDSFKMLKNKYQNQIDLHLGMEVEYSPLLDSYYRDLLKNELEYLIMGQHFHMEESMRFYNYDYYEKSAEKYVDDLVLGMRSGIILYVAHPDQLTYYYNTKDEHLRELCKRIISEAKITNTPLELNISKIEYNRLTGVENPELNAPFPLDIFWEIAGQEQVPVVIGLDAHTPNQVCEYGFNYALKYAEKHHLNVMKPIDIIKRMNDIKRTIK